MNVTRIRQCLFSLALLVLVSLFAPAAIFAQSTTQGAITGTVLDASGAVVNGATIVIHSDATNAEIKLVSDNGGYFKAPLLEPGTYTVKLSASGFANYTSKNVLVQVGQATSIEPHLSIASGNEEVVVSEQAPLINSESPEFTANLNTQALTTIPINNRRWSSLAMTTPGVVSDSNGYGLVSVRGVSPIMNNILIDGADDNQAYYSEERGRTREAYSTSSNAVREFAVNSGVYSAQYGRAAGGVIASVTKSGSNQLHADAYFFDRQSSWNAYNNQTVIYMPDSTGKYVPQHIKPKDLRKIYGFTASGALIPDKLFWIYTFDQHARTFPATGVPNSPSSFYAMPTSSTLFAGSLAGESCNTTTGYLTPPTAGASADPNYSLNSQICTLAARQGVPYDSTSSGAITGASLYNTWINNMNSDLGTVARTGNQEINTPKLDYQITPGERLSVLYHRLRWDSPGGVQTQPAINYARDTMGNDYVKLDYGVAKLTSMISTNISNELLYQYGRELNDESQQPYTDYTKNNLMGTGGNVPEVLADVNGAGFYMGSPYYSYRKALPDERKWQIGDIVYYNLKSHSLRFGIDMIHNDDLMNNTYQSNGYYTYSSVANYINDQINFNNHKTRSTCNSTASTASSATVSGVGTYSCYASLQQGFGSPVFAVDTMDMGFFIQDNWKISSRLTAEIGLRYDHEQIPGPKQNLIAATGTFVPYAQLSNNPSDKSDLGPRIGFAYDVYGRGKTVLRGGYGLYYGRLNNGSLLSTRLNTGSPNGQYSTTYLPAANGATPAGPMMPNIVTTVGNAPTPSSFYMDHNLRLPAVQEFDLALQQDMGHGTVLSLSYLGALGRRLPNFLNYNLDTTTMKTVAFTVSGDPTGKGPLKNNTVYNVPVYTAYGNTAMFGSVAKNYQAITDYISNINSNYNGFVVEVQNRSLKHVQFDANYTWAHALDFAQNAFTQTNANNWYDPFSNPKANYGTSAYNVPNRFIAYAFITIPNAHTTAYWKYLTNGWSINDSFQMQNGLPYTATLSGTFGARSGGWNGAGAPSVIPMVGYNTFRYPRRIVDDVRVEKDFGIYEKYHVKLLANVFNLANHQNVDGINNLAYKFVSGSVATGAVSAVYQPTFQQVTKSNNSGFLYTPRQFEIAAKFSF